MGECAPPSQEREARMDDDAPNEIQQATTAAVDALLTVMDKARRPKSAKEAR